MVGQGKVDQAAAMPTYQCVGTTDGAARPQTFSPNARGGAYLGEIGKSATLSAVMSPGKKPAVVGKMPPSLGLCHACPWRPQQRSRHAFESSPVSLEMAAPTSGCGKSAAAFRQGTC